MNNNQLEKYCTDTYNLIVGPSQLVEDFNTYLIINKETKIVEMEEPMLPKAIDYIQQITAALAEENEKLITKPVSIQ